MDLGLTAKVAPSRGSPGSNPGLAIHNYLR